jgi:hypothetical protein
MWSALEMHFVLTRFVACEIHLCSCIHAIFFLSVLCALKYILFPHVLLGVRYKSVHAYIQIVFSVFMCIETHFVLTRFVRCEVHLCSCIHRINLFSKCHVHVVRTQNDFLFSHVLLRMSYIVLMYVLSACIHARMYVSCVFIFSFSPRTQSPEVCLFSCLE